MNCKLVRRNIQRLINNELNSEEQEEMLRHLENCSDCKKEYNQQLEIEGELTKIFSTDSVDFKSSRKNIMDNIDKDKYRNSAPKDLGFMRRRNIKIISSIVAALIVISVISIATRVVNFNNIRNQKSTASMQDKSLKSEAKESSAKYESEKTDIGYKEKVFSKSDISKEDINSVKPENMTPWISIKGSSYSASIVGKGNEAQEEGYSKLFIKKNNELVYKFSLINEEKSQQTIKSIAWLDAKNILIVVANAHGTVISGSAVYSLYVEDEDGGCNLEYLPKSAKEKIKGLRLKRDDSGAIVIIDMVEYADDTFDKYTSFYDTIAITKVVEK